MKRFFTFLLSLVLISPIALLAKDAKPTLLVYGSGLEAFTAAVQAARSNVPTLWVVNADPSILDDTNQRFSIASNDQLDSGIWKELLLKAGGIEIQSDSAAMAIKKDLNVRLLVNAMEDILNREKSLTVLRNSDVVALERRRNVWRVTLADRSRHQVRAIVDASTNSTLPQLIEAKLPPSKLKPLSTYSTSQVRTIVALGEHQQTVYALHVEDILAQQRDNLFLLSPLVSSIADVEGIPLRTHISQAVGAAAAYCAFFKTEAKQIDVRKLQTELLNFQARFLPWKNITPEDPNYVSIQKAFLTTIFGDDADNRKTAFNTQEAVHIDSVRTIFSQYYSRSQLWFLDNKSTHFSLGDLLSFIKILAFRGDEIDAEIKKDWQKKLHFEGDYDVNRILSKYEFAVLVDRYANPFAKSITIEGTILR